MATERYERQMRIEGWNQQALEAATLTIVGHTTFSEYLAVSSAALGIGTVRLIATPDHTGPEAAFLQLSSKDRRQARLEEMITKTGPAKLEYLQAHMKSKAEQWFLRPSSVIIDATGRNESRALCLDYAVQTGTHCEMVGFDQTGFRMINQEENPWRIHDETPHGIDAICAMICAGVTLDETKKAIFKTHAPREPLYYSFTFDHEQPRDYLDEAYRKSQHDQIDYGDGIHAIVVGAGALGNFVVLGLAELGVTSIDIIDPDAIEETNLNRQIMFYGRVGKNKAEVLAERASRIYKRTRPKGTPCTYKGHVARLDKHKDLAQYIHTSKPDCATIVFDCVDNFKTRLLISGECTRENTQLISGGTNHRAGQVVTYLPFETSCPDHVLELTRVVSDQQQAPPPKKEERGGCIVAADPSVIMSNEVIAGMMVNEMRRLAYPLLFGEPINGQARYDATNTARIGTIRLAKRCEHPA